MSLPEGDLPGAPIPVADELVVDEQRMPVEIVDSQDLTKLKLL